MMRASVISLSEGTRSFGRRRAIDGVSLSVGQGEVVCVVGRSGAGKTTLLRCLALVEPLDHGEIRYKDVRVRRGKHLAVSWRRLPIRVGYVPQELGLWPHLTAIENVSLPLVRALRMSEEDALDRGRELLETFGLGDRAEDKPDSLSAGQRQRVAIARAVAPDPALLLLDEITSSLDVELVEGILNLVAELARDERAMILVTHQREFARRAASRVVLLEAGRVLEDGPPDRVLDRPRQERARRFLGDGGLLG